MIRGLLNEAEVAEVSRPHARYLVSRRLKRPSLRARPEQPLSTRRINSPMQLLPGASPLPTVGLMC